MLPKDLEKQLRFYFITDDGVDTPVAEQVKTAILGGATIIQYRKKRFTAGDFEGVMAARKLCKTNRIPFVVNDDIVLARAIEADGVHLGQDDESPAPARRILGDQAIIGVSVSTPAELAGTDTRPCDYIGAGPVFNTTTKTDAKDIIGLEGLTGIVAGADIPVVAIGGIKPGNAASCLAAGAAGVAVISCVTRTVRPLESARQLAAACGIISSPDRILHPWQDEFGLIRHFVDNAPTGSGPSPVFEVYPGDDAAVLSAIGRPVISTDAHIEGVHFDFSWQTPEEVGYKAAVVTLSDLAASYARPVAMFVNLTLPSHASEELAGQMYDGLKKALGEYDCALGGGNISRGRDVGVNLFVVGQSGNTIYPSRSGARPEHGLYCTGRLGLARAGLMSLQAKDISQPELIKKFKFPRARFDAAEILAEHGVGCAIDVSDGLAGDAAHIAEASGLTIAFDMEKEMVDPELAAFCERTGRPVDEMIFRGGEDYELLFACPPDQFQSVKNRLPDACRVGWCRPFSGTYLYGVPPGLKSFQHGF